MFAMLRTRRSAQVALASALVAAGAFGWCTISPNYEPPASTSVGDYKSVVVWCRAFTVLFTWAELR